MRYRCGAVFDTYSSCLSSLLFRCSVWIELESRAPGLPSFLNQDLLCIIAGHSALWILGGLDGSLYRGDGRGSTW